MNQSGMALALATLLLGGCVADQGPGSRANSADPLGFYVSQELVWEDCGFGALCSTALAPLDWDNPGSPEDVSLALVKYEATGEPQGSLFVNPGGPGASGFEYILESVDYAVDAPVREAFDVIGWDPRGVNRSSAVSCARSDKNLDVFLFGQLDAEPGSEAYEQELLSESIRFGSECSRLTGALLEFVDTASTVRDLDLLRHLVGDSQLNYLGYSYGTLIGALYIDTFPENVGRMVLDGPIDPGASQFDLVLNQYRGFEEALTAYMESCSAARNCAFSGTLEQKMQAVSNLYDELAIAPLPHSDGRLLDENQFRTAIVTSLYSSSSWSFLTAMFHEVQEGVTDTAFLLVDFYYDRSGGVYQDNSMEAFVAINCLDYPVERDPAVLAKQAQQLLEVAPYTAKPDARGDLVCQNWPHPPRLKKGPVSGVGAQPVLILGTTGDPATPYNWAVSLHQQLEQSVLLTLVGGGHLAYDEKDPCINAPVNEYFLTGTLPSDGLRCGG